MSEIDQDWIQRDLDGGAVWDVDDLPLDVIADLRSAYDHALEDEIDDFSWRPRVR